MSQTLAILEDTSQLPRCPHCQMEVKLRRFRERWVAYELSPMNRVFLGNFAGLLPFDKEFVFVPHVLCCGAQPCPEDPGLARLWERNRDRYDVKGDKHEHALYGNVVPVDIVDVAARLHMKLINNRNLTMTRSDAIAILDFMIEKKTSYPGGPELPPEELSGFQCVGISKKTKRRCGQRTTTENGLCYAHAPKDGLADQG